MPLSRGGSDPSSGRALAGAPPAALQQNTRGVTPPTFTEPTACVTARDAPRHSRSWHGEINVTGEQSSLLSGGECVSPLFPTKRSMSCEREERERVP